MILLELFCPSITQSLATPIIPVELYFLQTISARLLKAQSTVHRLAT
jgi:hypothetical protein